MKTKTVSGIPELKGARVKSRRALGQVGRLVGKSPLETATLYVGLDRGKADRNQTGRCAKQPGTLLLEDADTVFLGARRMQVGAAAFGTRFSTQGVYRDSPESGAVYQVALVPEYSGEAPQTFRENMRKLATKMSRMLCQDEVLLVLDGPSGRATERHTWGKKE
jgi:hypothetical protein